jgi:polyisoprenyl-phosphate glycosyltransferase
MNRIRMCVSVAVPVYNEEAVLPELLRRLRVVLNSVPGGPHEIVIVDDGSTDSTSKILQQESELDPRLVGVTFSRNFGHQAALSAALDYVSGDITIVMDGDLQDSPELIPLFIQKYNEGYDVVYAQRFQRKEVWWLRGCYYIFYRLIAMLSGIRLPLDAGDFGLMSRRVVKHLQHMPEYHRYLRGMRTWIGFRQIGLPVERANRQAGQTKYSAAKLLKLAMDGIFSFSIVPLRFAAFVGMLAILFSTLYALYAMYARLFLSQVPHGFTAIIFAVTFLAGIQLFFLGVIGEYVGRLYEASKARPVYIVDKQFGHTRSALRAQPDSTV